VGTVTQVGTDSISVQVAAGNRNVKEYVGEELILLLGEATKYMQWAEEGSVPIELADVAAGDTVNVHGILDEGTFTATRITVEVPLYCPAPASSG
jgi:hypothetical protein